MPYAFGLCGHGNIQFIDALHERQSDIKTISVHHESVCGFMADAYYRVKGQPVATFTSCGPGSMNLPIALATAYLDSVPFLAVTGNVPTSQFGRGAFQELYRQHQADFPSTVRSVCKKVYQPTRGEQVPMMVRQAWKTMVTGRPGPVVLDVPFDVFMEAAAEETPKPEEWSANISSRCGADPDGVKKTVDMLLVRRAAGHPGRPGREIRRRHRRSAALAEKLQIPVAHSMSGIGAIDTQSSAVARPAVARRRLSGQRRGAAGRRAAGARRALRRPHLELVDSRLLVHHPADQAHPRRHRSGGDRPQLSGRARADGGRADLPAPGAGRACDTRKGVADAAASRRKWLATIDGYRKEWNKFIAPGFTDDSTPIHPQRAAAEIDKALPDDAIMVSDIGVHHNWLLQFCKPKRPDSFIGCMGFGSMGFGVAGVLGAKFAAPDRPCVSVCGDGAFFMHANVLGTAVEYNLPVVWVVWNNYAYASIRGLQRGYLDGRELATDFHHPETGKPYNPDFAAMARSAGVEGVRVDRAGDIGNAIRMAIAANKPYLIDVNINADQNPGGAGVWELPGLGVSKVAIGGRYQP